MKNYTLSVKTFIRLALAICIAVICLPVTALAQSVNVTMSVFPPYSPYYADYSGANASKVLMVIQNLTGTQLKIKLTGKLEGDNGILISTRNNYVPQNAIILNPRETKQLNGLALKDVFNLDNLNVYGIDKMTLAQTSRVPEGNYNLCVQVADYATGKVLSAQAPMGCAMLSIVYPEPPILISPMPDAKVRATKPQNIIFNWTNPGAVPNGTQYRLEVAEMPDNIKAPNQVLNAVSFPTLRTTLPASTYVYNASNLALKPGKRYAWRVVSVDPSKRTVFRNKGMSPASVFVFEAETNPFSAQVRVTPPKDVVQAGIQPDLSAAQNGILKTLMRKYSVSGKLFYQYHKKATDISEQAFTGRRLDSVILRYNKVQLCYGLCTVNMDIVKKAAVNLDQPANKKDAKLANQQAQQPQPQNNAIPGKNVIVKQQYEIDSIPMTGVPVMPVEPSGKISGGLGEVLATTQTDTNGVYRFDFSTARPCKIEKVLPGNRALVHCYYINVVNQHYTDPNVYVYAKTPDEDEEATIAVGTRGVYVKNYQLNVGINRNNEVGSDLGKDQNVSVENKPDEMGVVYILTDHAPGNIYRPYDDGDNSGMVQFLPAVKEAAPYFNKGKFYIVAKKQVPVYKDKLFGLIGTFYGSHLFNNLVDNAIGENYWVYAEYKSKKIFFQPQQINFPSKDNAAYQPVVDPVINSYPLELKPTLVSVKIKGVLKYAFKNGTPKPLPNTWVSLHSKFYNVDLKTKQHNYVTDDPKTPEKQYAVAKTDANGYFELDAGQVDYSEYKSGNYEIAGWSQFIKVESPYYGSPDQAYTFEGGNTYNVGEIVANVKEYTLNVSIKGLNAAVNKVEKMPNQRVFLCRRKDQNVKVLGIPQDEGEQNALPLKEIKDKDGNNYRVVSYGITKANGTYDFKHLIVQDPNKVDDNYYIYTESAILSTSNYSSEYAEQSNVRAAMYLYKSINTYPVLNSQLNNKDLYFYDEVQAYPQKPVIDGGVYPFSNTSTNAMADVEVRLIDVLADGSYTAEKFEDEAKLKDPFNVFFLKTIDDKKTMRVQATQKTGANGLFSFSNELTNQYKGWKLLIYTKAGFISGYTVINSGKPMVNGTKQNVKGLLMPPRRLYTTVKDAFTGAPVKAKIIVGDDFSWVKTLSVKSNYKDGFEYKSKIIAEAAHLTSTFGPVKFTVVPEDNVNYKTQEFTRQIAFPKYEKDKMYVDDKEIEIPAFEMMRPVTQVTVVLKDAETDANIAGFAQITKLPANETPAKQIVMTTKAANFNVQTNAAEFGVLATAPGYTNQEVKVTTFASPNTVSLVVVEMAKGLTIQGDVLLNNQPLAGAKVYIKQLSGIYPDVYTDAKGHYIMANLPVNYEEVSIVASAAQANAIGQSQQVTLSPPPAPNGKKSTYNRTVNFALVKNTQYDLASLYGFPLDVETFMKMPNGGYRLTGRIKVPDNTSVKAASTSYLSFNNLVIAEESQQNNLGQLPDHAQAAKKISLKPVSNKVTFKENSFDVFTFNNYPANLYAADGIQLLPKNDAKTQGSIHSSLQLTSGGFNKGVSWAGNMLLLPESAMAAALKEAQESGPVNNTGNLFNNATITKANAPNGVNVAIDPKSGGNIGNLPSNTKKPGDFNANDLATASKDMTTSKAMEVTQGAVKSSDNGNKATGGANISQYSTPADLVAGKNLADEGKNMGNMQTQLGQPAQSQTNTGINKAMTEAAFDVFLTQGAGEQFTSLRLMQPYANDKVFYTLNNIFDVEARKASYFDKTGLHLFSTVHTQIANVAQPDLALDAGEVVATSAPLNYIQGKTDLTIPLDDWKLTGKWYIDKSSISLSGQLFAGTITLPVKDMQITKTNIGYGDVEVTQIGLAGVYKVKINPAETLTAFGFDKAAKYGTLYNQAFGAWSLSLLPTDAAKPLTQLANLKDLAPSDLVNIMNISLYSKGGESRVMLMQDHPKLTLNGFTDFQPYDIENGADFFKINGALDLKIPALTGLSDKVYGLMYASDGKSLIHKHQALPELNIVTNGIRVLFNNVNDQVFTQNKLVLKGILSDKVASSPYNLAVKLTKTSAQENYIAVTDSAINIVNLGDGQKLANISGAMSGGQYSWNNFAFEGDVKGAKGIREEADKETETKKTHMAFDVKGDIVANKAEIGVKNLKMGKATNMNFTYDFDKKAILGSFHLDEKTENASFHTDFEMQLGGGIWYMLGSAKVDSISNMPVPVNGAGGAVLIGKCTITPDMMQIIQSKFHDGILPDKFNEKFHDLSGTLLVTAVDINLPLIPDINLDLGPIAHATVEKGIYANTYMGLDFEEVPKMSGGVKVGVYVKVSAGASVLVGCAGLKLGAEVNAQVNSELELPTFKEFLTFNPQTMVQQTKITIGGKAEAILSGEAYYGWGVCDDDCSSIKVWGVKIPPGCHKSDIGKTLTIDFGADVLKDKGTLTPNKADVFVHIFGKEFKKDINIPNLKKVPGL